MTAQNIDERIRLLELKIDSLVTKMTTVFIGTGKGIFYKHVLMSNGAWTQVSATKVYTKIVFHEISNVTPNTFTIAKDTFLVSELSTDSANPTAIAELYGGITLDGYLDSDGLLQVRYSASGYNVSTLFHTQTT